MGDYGNYLQSVLYRAWAESWAMIVKHSPADLIRNIIIFALTLGLAVFLQGFLVVNGVMSEDNSKDTVVWLGLTLVVIVCAFAAYFIISAIFISPFLLWREANAKAHNISKSEYRRISTQQVFPLYELACLAGNSPISTNLSGPAAAYAYNIKSALIDVLLEEAEPKTPKHYLLKMTSREDQIRNFSDDERIDRNQARKIFNIIGIEVEGITN